MEQRIYHGTLTPGDFAQALIAEFNHGNLMAQQLGSGDKVLVQVATRPGAASGGNTAVSISLQKVTDGVAVQLGQQAWLGVAADIGKVAFSAWRNPLSLLGQLDDLAQDIENMQLCEQIWNTVNQTANAAGASFELSERLKRSVCPYCGTANPVGEPSCIACGAPLGQNQPRTCLNCGFVLKAGEQFCPNCGKALL